MNRLRLPWRSRFFYTVEKRENLRMAGRSLQGRAAMNNFIFENSTKAYFGKGCVKEYLTCLMKHCGKRVMFAYGGESIRDNGIYDEVMGCLAEAEKDIVTFSGIMENPTYEKVLEGAALARENKVDFILAVGGGSVTDCCKAVSMAAVYEGDLWNDFFARAGVVQFEPLPLGVVVTEAQTGSEMNGRAVITNAALKIRMGRDYPECNPEFALIDPAYICGVPERQMVSDGFAALSHIMEIYFSKPDEDNVSDDIAEALMKNVIQNLRAAIVNPQDYTARSNLIWDAVMAQNRILKLGKQADFQCQQMVDQLAAYTNCDQGEGLAVLHPAYCRHIYKDGSDKFKRFAVNVWGISNGGATEEETAREGVEAFTAFIREIGLPVTLREIGADENTDLGQIAGSCILSAGSYKKMTHREIFAIFQECY